jgi:hypothetical protein
MNAGVYRDTIYKLKEPEMNIGTEVPSIPYVFYTQSQHLEHQWGEMHSPQRFQNCQWSCFYFFNGGINFDKI